MQMPDEEWAAWMDEFKASAEAADLDLDPTRLANRVMAETRKQWWGLAGELAMGAIGLGVYGVMIVRGTSAAVLAIAAASFALSVVWVVYLYQVRRGTWRSLGRDTRTALALTLARRRADTYWYRFAGIATAVFAVAAAVWAPLMLSAYRDVYVAEPWRALLGFGGAYGILAWLFVRAQRKLGRARREQRALEAAYRDLVEPS